VRRGRDGYLRVYYGKLGLKFQRYDQWYASGGRHIEDNGGPFGQSARQ
jgi:hypothetical protein